MGACILATKCRMDIDESGYWKPICQGYALTCTYNWGGGCISDMSICRKMQNRVNVGVKRRIFM
jgi:hypothetical protein